MAREDLYEDELEEDFIDDELDDDEDNETNEAVAGVGAWGISFVVHIIAVLSLFLIVYANTEPERAPIQIVAIEAPPPPEEEEKERDIIEKEVTVEVESENDVVSPTVTELDLPVEEIETEDEVVSENPAKGREEAVSASEMGGAGAFMAIGAGGGSAGAFGNRNGGGRKRAVGAFGGSRASESAVEAALRWFARHQSPNGQWDIDGYPQNCTLEGPKCEPGGDHTGEDGDIGSTGYAVLCYLGAGYDHKVPNKWRKTVKGGIDWLVSVQRGDGMWGERNYEHPIALMAIAEAYAMTNDPALKGPAQKGIDALLARQLQVDGYPNGWNYTEPLPDRVDSSITGWCVMALKSAKAGGLSVGQGLEGGKNFLEMAWKMTNPNWQQFKGGSSPSGNALFPYTINPALGIAGKEGRDGGGGKASGRESIGALCAVFLGKKKGDVLLETLANTIMANQVPTGYPTDTYYMYYNTLAMFQLGGDRWDTWNNQVRDIIVGAQRTDGCFDGSWDWEGTEFHGHETGRLISTAYNCLSLEVYYRYLPVAMQ